MRFKKLIKYQTKFICIKKMLQKLHLCIIMTVMKNSGIPCGPGFFRIYEVIMKPFRTIDEQISILKERGLNIADEAKAKTILSKENYYNLINGYKRLFVNDSEENEVYKEGCSFEEIYELYVFDRDLRNIFFKPMLQIENELKTQIAYVFSKYHQDTNYLQYSNFETLSYTNNQKTIAKQAKNIYGLIAKLQNDISFSIKNKSYVHHYVVECGYVPLWVLVNALPLNRLSIFYNYMNQAERVEISKHWNVNEKELRQFISCIAYFRNLCAHDERFFEEKSDSPITDNDIHAQLSIPRLNDGNYEKGKTDLFSLLITLKMLLDQDDFNTVFNKVNDRIISLADKLHTIPIEDVLYSMGFPNNWRYIKQV